MNPQAHKYLHSEVGKLAEELKKAYLAGQHIVYVIAPDPDVVREALRIEPIFKHVNKKSTASNAPVSQFGSVPSSQNLFYGVGELDKFPSKGNPSICVVQCGIEPSATAELNKKLTEYCAHIFDLTYNDERRDTALKSMVIVVTPVSPEIPAEIASECRIVRVAAPEECEIRQTIIQVVEDLDGIHLVGKPGSEIFLRGLLQNTKGLSLKKIRHTFNRIKAELDHVFILPEDKRFERLLAIIIEEKGKLIENSGILKLQKTGKSQKKVDGMANLTEWLRMRAPIIQDPQTAMSRALINQPKGVLLSGIPGTGKSLAAKTTSAEFGGLPLIQLDMGNIMDKYQGESERKLEEALKLAEAMSPCILWIDEIEKGMAGASSGSGSESMQRIFGKLLTWMQEKEQRGVCCFVFATANSIDSIPPEFFRSGRFDEKFYTFLPSAQECVDIFLANIQSQNHRYRALNGIAPDDKRQLFDPGISDRKYFMDLLNSNAVIRHQAQTTDQRPSTDNKFLTGSDIEALIERAKLLMYNDSQIENQSSPYVYSAERMRTALRRALDEAQTYSQTNARDVAICYSKLASYNFKPVSKHEIAPFSLYTELTPADLEDNKDAKPFDLTSDKATALLSDLACTYDKQLLIYVGVAINRYITPKERNR